MCRGESETDGYETDYLNNGLCHLAISKVLENAVVFLGGFQVSPGAAGMALLGST